MLSAHLIQRSSQWRTFFYSRGLTRKQLWIQPTVLRVLKHQHPAGDCREQNNDTSDHTHPTVQPEKNAAKFHAGLLPCLNSR